MKYIVILLIILLSHLSAGDYITCDCQLDTSPTGDTMLLYDGHLYESNAWQPGDCPCGMQRCVVEEYGPSYEYSVTLMIPAEPTAPAMAVEFKDAHPPAPDP